MKTIGFLITNILELAQNKKSIILTDPKGEIYRITSQYMRDIGYNVKVFNLNNLEHSDRWNPLAENQNISDVQTSADVIISNTQIHSKKSDDFWPRAEENLLKALELYFLENKLEQNTISDIYKKITSCNTGDLDKLFKKLDPNSAAKMSYNIFASGSDTIKASVITGLGTRLQSFQDHTLQRLTNESDIDLELPAKEPCIYYTITSDVDSSLDFLASLYFTFLFIKLVRYADSRPNGKCDVDIFFLLDEFANIGVIPDFNKKISTVRSRGISIIPIAQNIAQLKNRYSMDMWQEIIGNCDIRLCMAASDILTAEYFSSMLGITTVETQSIRKESGFDGELEFGTKNISTLKRNLLNVDEILRIPTNKLIAVVRGNKPILLDKMIYKDHPASKNLKDSSILDYIPNYLQKTSTNTDNLKNEDTKENSNDKNKSKKTIKHVKMSFDNF